jgi:SAM-dependent methyltransferase
VSEAPQIFDRARYAARVAKARREGPDILNRTLAAELAERVSLITRSFSRACVIAPDPDLAAEALAATGRITVVQRRAPPEGEDFGFAAGAFDAIFNLADLHAMNDVPGALVQMRQALSPDGLLLACLFAGDTLAELRQSWLAAEAAVTGGATPRVAPMIGMRELGALLQRVGLALPVADLDRTVVRYADALAVIHEIGRLGMANVMRGRSQAFVSRRLLAAVLDHYHAHFADADGRIRATIELAWLTAWSPHESQQQPLKPGSAKMRLAEALSVPETRLKD